MFIFINVLYPCVNFHTNKKGKYIYTKKKLLTDQTLLEILIEHE